MTDEDETADDVFAPPAVRFDLSPEMVTDMAHTLRGLLDPKEIELLAPKLRAEHRVVLEQLDALTWDEPARAVEQAVEILKNATRPDGPIDPNDDEGDVPWIRMLLRLRDVPVLGARAARRWFVHLHALRSEDIAVSTMTESTAAYTVAAFEHLRGKPHEVERWWTTAALMTDCEPGVGLGLVAYVRAARLLEGVLPQRPASGS